MHSQERIQTGEERWEAFLDELLVVCPKCEGTALVLPVRTGELGLFASRQVTCTHCGFSKHSEGNSQHMDWYAEPMRDSYFHLPLRLQVRCGRHLLWAYNHRRLGFIEAFVQASLRERLRHPTSGWHNAGLTSRLPKWLKSAHHRKAILKAIASLRSGIHSPSQ
jgi:hypothetical protein